MQENGDNLVELLLLPKIGRAKAKVLYSHGYKNIADIAAADPLDLSKVPGISLELAKEMVSFVKVMGSADSEDTHTITCPMCGTMVPDGTKSCSGCGITFTNEWEHAVGEKYSSSQESEDGHLYNEEKSTLFICPECGSLVSDGSTKCPNCGVLFDDDEDELEPVTEIDGAEKELDGHQHKEQEQLFMCPNCGSFISADADGCNACGIVFEDDGDEELATPEIPVCPMCSTDLVEGAKNCNNCGFEFVGSPDKEHDEFWMKEQDGLFMCPNCGIFLPNSASQCSACGVAFEGDDEDAEPETEEPDILFCPMCNEELVKGSQECKNCGFDFSAKADGFWIKEQKGLFMCPSCGSLAADGTESCSSCGVLFEEDEEEETAPAAPSEPKEDKEDDGHWYKEQNGLSMCPSCGSFIASDASVCNACGIAFDDEEEELEQAPDFVTCPMCQSMLPATSESCDDCGFDFSAEREQDGFWYKKSGSLFICPKCGAFLSEATDTCHNCGLAFVDEEVMEEKVEKLIDSVELEHELDSVIDVPEEDAQPSEKDAGAPEDEDIDSLYLCPICGAFIEANLTKCPSCHTVFDDIEDIYLEPVSSIQENIISPEALSKEISAEIEEIEAELLGDSPEQEKKGISKSFLDRWEKTDAEDDEKPSLISDFKKRWESSQATDEQIEEDLGLGALIVEDEEIDDLLIADIDESEDHEFWAMRAKECAARGDIDEAIACLDKAA